MAGLDVSAASAFPFLSVNRPGEGGRKACAEKKKKEGERRKQPDLSPRPSILSPFSLLSPHKDLVAARHLGKEKKKCLGKRRRGGRGRTTE